MNTEEKNYLESFDPILVAPCGMNCALCIAHLRDRDRCAGCLSIEKNKAKHCATCHIKNCTELAGPQQKYCFECQKFPCTRLRDLDKRYRTKYGMSMIENLETMREVGLGGFLEREKDRWQCSKCGRVISVHRPACLYCGTEWRREPGTYAVEALQ